MDLLKNLLGDTSCGLDGTVSSQNPLNAVVDQFFDTGLADTELITQDMSGGVSSGGSSILYMEPQTPGTFDHIGATLQTSGGISERNMQAAWNDDSFKVIGGGSIMGNGANFNAGIQMQQMMQNQIV